MSTKLLTGAFSVRRGNKGLRGEETKHETPKWKIENGRRGKGAEVESRKWKIENGAEGEIGPSWGGQGKRVNAEPTRREHERLYLVDSYIVNGVV